MSRTDSVRDYKCVPYLLNSLPEFVKCQNDYTRRPMYKPKREALLHKFIQLNNKLLSYFVLDCDNPAHNLTQIDKLGLKPVWTAMNRDYSGAHCVIELTEPISLHDNSRAKPRLYAYDVYDKLADAIGADRAFRHSFYTKNPLHTNWRLAPAEQRKTYELNELNELVPTYQPKLSGFENHSSNGGDLFAECAPKARANVLDFKRHNKTYEEFFTWCLTLCIKANKHLPYSKVEDMANCIADWCWNVYTGEGGASYWSPEQQRKGGLSWGRMRRERTKEIDRHIVELHNMNYSNAEIARELNVTRGKVYRVVKRDTI